MVLISHLGKKKSKTTRGIIADVRDLRKRKAG